MPKPRPTSAEVTEILGPKCPHCGWRRGAHRPQLLDWPPCPGWIPGQNKEEETP